MKKTQNGQDQMPRQRNANSSAAGRTTGNAVQRNASQRQMQRGPQQPQRTSQMTSRQQGQRAAQTVQRTPQQGQRTQQVQRASQRPVQRTDRSQQRQAPANAKKPVQKTAVPSYNFIKPLLIAVAALLVILAGVRGYLFFKDENGLLKNEVTIEAGSAKPELSMFFEQEPAIPGLVSSNLDFDSVNTALPQTINFNISIYGKNNACKLIIADTVPPAGTGIAQSIFACDALPDAAGCVTGIEDITDVTVSWKDVPDMSAGGSFIVSALLTDGCGNETVVGVPFEVTKDSSAPVIEGAQDLQYYIGDTVSYRNGISVTDDYDTAPSLEINTDNVILTEEGTYEVVYTARDFSGNEASETVSIKVEKKPEGYVEPEVVYAAAKEILDEITEPGMTEEEIALQIVWWCRYNIHFILRTYSNSWTEAAYNAFKTRTGNCFSTAYAVKALLDVAGIENMIIERYPYETATHFWNYVKLDGQWYHCDATWREGYDSYFFMYTTKELLDFWQGGWNGFQFKQDKFPESATKSVQSRIDYKNHTFKDE